MGKIDNFKRSVLVANTLLNAFDEQQTLEGAVKKWADDQADVTGYYFRNKAWPVGKIRCMNCCDVFEVEHGKNADLHTEGVTVYKRDNGRTFYTSTIKPTIEKRVAGTAVCPHCGRPLKVEQGRKFLDHGYQIVGIPSVVMGIHVLRVYECSYWLDAKAGRGFRNKDDRYNTWREVLRKWTGQDESGEREVISSCGMNMGWNNDTPWAHNEILVRNENVATWSRQQCEYQYANPKFVWDGEVQNVDLPQAKYVMQTFEALKQYRSKGIEIKRMLNRIASLPIIESAVKAGYTGAAWFLANDGFGNRGEWLNDYLRGQYRYIYKTSVSDYANALRICMKNNCQIEDPQMYCDYLDDLIFLCRDIRNAHYICPPNLMEAHNATTEEVNQYRMRNAEIKAQRDAEKDEERLEREMKEAAMHEQEYIDMKGAFLGIAFGESSHNLQFHVIGSVAEMKEEGFRMHHCVGGYWNRRDSLIIGCRDVDDKRVATIEVNLRDFSIVQTRGVCNEKPPYFDIINEAINNNMDMIRKAAMQQKAQAVRQAECSEYDEEDEELNLAM